MGLHGERTWEAQIAELENAILKMRQEHPGDGSSSFSHRLYEQRVRDYGLRPGEFREEKETYALLDRRIQDVIRQARIEIREHAEEDAERNLAIRIRDRALELQKEVEE